MRTRIKLIFASVKLIIAYIISKFWINKEPFWIIAERPEQARDNGYCFYRYLKQEHPEQQVYYLIRTGAVDYSKVTSLGNSVIHFDSFKHYIYYCKSLVHISAHVNGCCPTYAIPASKRLKKIIGFKDIFLPHGVSYGISEFCLKKYTDINMFICSGKPEYDNVLENYGYSMAEVAYTGFPRLDSWHNIGVNPKQILLMPTWRSYLAQDPNTVFEITPYFRAYKELIQSDELACFLRIHNAKLVFYLHNEMQKYMHYFVSDCQEIEIVYDDSTYDIQELLKTSAMLITDYSSVHFDFAYMNKPVIYYQFDRMEFFEKQYQQSGFDAKVDGFGPVCETVEEVCSSMKHLFSEKANLKPEYYKRMRAFYQIYDNHNCQRVYETICEMKVKSQ